MLRKQRLSFSTELMTIGQQALASKNKNDIIRFLQLPFERNGLYSSNGLIQPCNLFDKNDLSGNTILHLAAVFGPLESVKLILEEFPDVNLQTRNRVRDSPLHLAIKFGNRDVVLLLMNAGASVSTICHFNPLSKIEQDYTQSPYHRCYSNALGVSVKANEIEIFLDIFEFSPFEEEIKEYLR